MNICSYRWPQNEWKDEDDKRRKFTLPEASAQERPRAGQPADFLGKNDRHILNLATAEWVGWGGNTDK
jgi:hypothetical protein